MADVTSASAESLINAVSAGNSAADNRFGEIASLISSGFQSNDPKFTELKTDFLGRLDSMKGIITNSNMDISQDLRNTFNAMTSSFDETGNLITGTVLENGNTITRAIDQQGNLFTAQFNQYGKKVSQGGLNINQLMMRLDELGYVPGSNQNMANATGSTLPSYSQYDGLVSPFAQTAG